MLTLSGYRAIMVSIAFAPTTARDNAGLLARRISATTLFGVVIGWLACDLLLLSRFLGLASPWVYGGWALSTAVFFWLFFLPRRGELRADPSLGTLIACIGVALVLMLLGGEGRFFYANVDWQVRDAVLHDMASRPWPYVYPGNAILHAPIGMYLAPALAGKAWGQAGADLALLAQNSLLLGLMLAIGSTLFADRRRQLIALALFLLFSGLDVIGQLKAGHGAGLTPAAHLEGWGPSQFSSTITLIFWVPLHALPGWLAALATLLWRERRLGLGALLALPPLVALWSPFASMGAMPFVLYAAWHDLRRGRITAVDIALPCVATAIALPALLYLAAGNATVGFRFFPIRPALYLLFLTIELLPFLLIANAGRRGRFGGALLAVAAVALIAAPLIQLGNWIDFAMRASIPALALLALHLGDGLGGGWPMSPRRRAALLALLGLGSVTGLTEIVRAISFPLSPPPRCSVIGAFRESFAFMPNGYVAPLDRMPAAIRPYRPALSAPDDGRPCYDRPWPKPPLY